MRHFLTGLSSSCGGDNSSCLTSAASSRAARLPPARLLAAAGAAAFGWGGRTWQYPLSPHLTQPQTNPLGSMMAPLCRNHSSRRPPAGPTFRSSGWAGWPRRTRLSLASATRFAARPSSLATGPTLLARSSTGHCSRSRAACELEGTARPPPSRGSPRGGELAAERGGSWGLALAPPARASQGALMSRKRATQPSAHNLRKHGASLWLQRRPRGLLALTDRLLTAYAHPANIHKPTRKGEAGSRSPRHQMPDAETRSAPPQAHKIMRGAILLTYSAVVFAYPRPIPQGTPRSGSR